MTALPSRPLIVLRCVEIESIQNDGSLSVMLRIAESLDVDFDALV